MKKILCLICLLLCLVACKSNEVTSPIKEVLNIDDLSSVKDAYEDIDVSISNNDYTVKIVDVIAYHNYFMLIGQANDTSGNVLSIEDYTFTINDLDTYDLNVLTYDYRNVNDKYFIVTASFDGADLLKGDTIKLLIYEFGNNNDSILLKDGLKADNEDKDPLLEIDITVNNIGETNVLGDENTEIELTHFYLTVFSDHDLTNDSVKLYDKDGKELNINSSNAARYNEYVSYFDSYYDISNINQISVDNEIYSVIGVK